jgi:hypothetical protein
LHSLQGQDIIFIIFFGVGWWWGVEACLCSVDIRRLPVPTRPLGNFSVLFVSSCSEHLLVPDVCLQQIWFVEVSYVVLKRAITVNQVSHHLLQECLQLPLVSYAVCASLRFESLFLCHCFLIFFAAVSLWLSCMHVRNDSAACRTSNFI